MTNKKNKCSLTKEESGRVTEVQIERGDEAQEKV